MPKRTAEWFTGKRITVMGLGVHGGGFGSAKWLLKRGALVTVTDLRDEKILAKPIAALTKLGARAAHPVRFVIGRHDEKDFSGADMVIKNPAVPRGNAFIALAEKNGVPVETDTGIFFSLCPFPIAAVSGTKGKTTTTTLLASIAKAHDRRTVVGGNIRISQLDALDALLRLAERRGVKPPPIILELSSWQLEGLELHRLSPHVGLLTNIKEDHLNRYDGMDDYARSKELILAYQKPEDVAVVNADDARVAAIGMQRGAITNAPNAAQRLWFSVKPLPRGRDGAFVRAGSAVLRVHGKETVLFPVSAIKLRGAHNVGNVLSACVAAFALGIPLATIRRVVRAFRSVPYRLEDIATKRGVRFVNDTTATAPDASIAALETFAAKGDKKRIVLIAGGADKSLTFGTWARAVKKHAKHLVLFEGTATQKMADALVAAKARVPQSRAGSMKEAVAAAVHYAKKGDVVLLSPGCASFGIFLNEFDRGDQFNRLVRALR